MSDVCRLNMAESSKGRDDITYREIFLLTVNDIETNFEHAAFMEVNPYSFLSLATAILLEVASCLCGLMKELHYYC